jgi:hypothetical protein
MQEMDEALRLSQPPTRVILQDGQIVEGWHCPLGAGDAPLHALYLPWKILRNKHGEVDASRNTISPQMTVGRRSVGAHTRGRSACAHVLGIASGANRGSGIPTLLRHPS